VHKGGTFPRFGIVLSYRDYVKIVYMGCMQWSHKVCLVLYSMCVFSYRVGVGKQRLS
jgi:hypothetical protein